MSSTPTFLGANPAEVRSGPKKGSRALAAEEDTARTLLDSLSAAQRGEAIVDEAPYGDIVSRNRSKADPLEGRGLAFAKLTPPQQKQLLALIELYAGDDEAEARRGAPGEDPRRRARQPSASPGPVRRRAAGRTTTACRGRRS